ncbi:CRISPR-associated helicase Cas3' [Falsiroseomonas sp. CW058]|uniref:CRISPR-associated helicase Cas3' n=1 Tax=Falsiroseomonas sp. CW058 TaxID=3388664 RepID=UPI003D313FE5
MLDGTAQFWGKARAQVGGDVPWHPLVAHALDVAAVAVLLPRPQGFGMGGGTLGFLVALHDIGKFSRPFQGMVPERWPGAVLGAMPREGVPAGPKHDAMGFSMLAGPLASALDRILPPRIGERRAWIGGHRAPLLRALAGHHGRPPAPPPEQPPRPDVLCAACLDAAAGFVESMAGIFAPSPLPRPVEREVHALAWRLAGLVTLADWIGSRQDWFPYVPPDAVAEPGAYFWDHALPRAAAALAAAGLSPPRPAPFRGLRGLFPAIEEPSPLQSWAERVQLPAGPVLAVVEDLTGSGKTEAAMTLAHRLIAEGRAGGVFLALPTMATANAMFGRLAGAYRGLFAAEAHPSLALAHARAALDPRFRAAIPAGPEAPPSPAAGTAAPRATDPADEPAEAHCAAWLAEDRRRTLLAQVGVGTLDQALLAVLPVRHAALRLQGLAGKVLVIDEVHAFDPYMQREMLALLEFHAALGGSAVLLSATLPRAIRGRLVDAFRRGLALAPAGVACDAYPLVTLASAGGVAETPCPPRRGLPRRVVVTRVDDVAAAVARIEAAAQAGAAVAWVRNTVDDAVAAAEALRARGLAPILFHARFALRDRLEIEEEVLRRFGRGSGGEARRRVLVATQVIEQSLDLDFDLLVTDLAPVDLLIQRAGRLWRHARDPRPVPGPEMLVVSPEPVEDPPADWIGATQPGTEAVYRDPALLWRGARALFRRGAIATPDDMRPLVEEASDDAAPDALPAALAKAAGRAAGKDAAATSVARQNVLAFAPAYDRSAGFWEPEDRTPTRLEDRPTVTLRLAVVRDGAVVPYAEDPDPHRAWALSEVSVARQRVAGCAVPAGLEAAAEAAKAGWGRWERESDRLLLAVMVGAQEGFRIHVTDGSGTAQVAAYHAGTGLRFD